MPCIHINMYMSIYIYMLHGKVESKFRLNEVSTASSSSKVNNKFKTEGFIKNS